MKKEDGITEREKELLGKYFNQLNDLISQEIAVEQAKADAIKDQAKAEGEYIGQSYEEYYATAQKWISTAQEQKDKTIKLAEERYTGELAQLNLAYKTQEERQSEAYKKEYDKIVANKESAIAEAQDRFRQVNDIYANGFYQMGESAGGFVEHYKYWMTEYANEEQRYEAERDEAFRKHYKSEQDRRTALGKIEQQHLQNQKNIWRWRN